MSNHRPRALSVLRPSLVAFVAVLVMLLPAAAAGAVTPQEFIAALNAQRAANGIPAAVVASADHAATCKPEASVAQSPPSLDINDDTSMTAYGFGGGWTSGVSAETPSWTATRSPFDDSWWSIKDLFEPGLVEADWTETAPNGCLSYSYDRRQFQVPGVTFYAYTGPRGRTAIPFKVSTYGTNAKMLSVIGVNGVDFTGPAVLAWAKAIGPWAYVDSATLSTAAGQGIDAWVLDWRNHYAFDSSAAVIAKAPLLPNTEYIARLNWRTRNGGPGGVQEVRFRTIRRIAQANMLHTYVDRGRLISKGRAHADKGARLRWRVTRPDGHVRTRISNTFSASSKPGRWTLCISAGGGPNSDYYRVQDCMSFRLSKRGAMRNFKNTHEEWPE